MSKRTFYCGVVIWLLLVGCVKIPEHNSTVGKYSELHNINTECSQEKNILPTSASAIPQQGDELNSQGFILLNWNSHKGNDKGWLKDLERLSEQSDLLVLQEGYLTDDLQDTLNKKKFNWDIAQAFTYNDIYTGVLTASRVKPDYLCSFRTFEPLSGIPKTVLITRYPLSGTQESLLLANIHMINVSFDISAYREQLEKIVEVLSQHLGPLIISGDFNSWSTKRMKVLNDVIQKLGVEAVVFATDNRTMFMGQRVDHIYYRQLETFETFSEKVTTSDHNPMLVSFRLENDV
jgi:endonuclease/exonuclease/phosphatase (EEP) superfamily protein YafD